MDVCRGLGEWPIKKKKTLLIIVGAGKIATSEISVTEKFGSGHRGRVGVPLEL